MDDRPSISAIILTLNEEKRLPYALRSVTPWVDEIVVVDMQSDDRTVDIAREMGAKIYTHERVEFFESARALGLEKSSGDWILVLDADELIPAPLSHTLVDLSRSSVFDAVEIPRLNYLHGVPMGHARWGPDQDKQTRFFRRGFVHAGASLHEGLLVQSDARIKTLRYSPAHAIVHFCWKDFSHSIDKLNAYTSYEAKVRFRRNERSSPSRAAKQAAAEFVDRFVRAKGYRDGWRGFYMSCFAALYRIAIHAKMKELSLGGPEGAKAEQWRIAEQWLSGYDHEGLAVRC